MALAPGAVGGQVQCGGVVSVCVAVSVIVFTLNEEIHLPSCLDALAWCDDVIVVDSFSTDATRALCEQRDVHFFQHRFIGFGSQRNWALDNANPKHPWVLILDADERVTPELAVELGAIAAADPKDVGAWRVRRRFYMWGRWLRYSSLYPTWVVRFIRRDRVRYQDRGHAETQTVIGKIADLQNDLIDENLKGIDEWYERQNRYSRKEAQLEFDQAGTGLRIAGLLSGDPLQRREALKRLAWRLPARGFIYFLYSYFLRRGFLDGRDGYVFCRMRASYQVEVDIKKYDLWRSSAEI